MQPLLPSTLLAAMFVSTAAHASGQLDSRFDGDGVRVVEASNSPTSSDRIHAGLIDSAGRIVAAGRAAKDGEPFGSVIRMSASGVLDAGFGEGGIVRIPPLEGYGQTRWVGVAEQADGKLVVAGDVAEPDLSPSDHSRAYVCRLQIGGALDPAFGNGGCTQPQFWFDSNHDLVFAMALQEDGRIVLLGSTDVDGTGVAEYVVARLDSDGSYDTCFGDVTCTTGGLRIEPEPDADIDSFSPRALALAPDGRIVLAGDAMGNGSRDMAVIRLLPTGEVDLAFGNGGHRLVAFEQGGSNFDAALSVAVSGNGAVRMAGSVGTPLSVLIGVAALDATGTPVPEFGNGGRNILFFNDVSPIQEATGIRLQHDGKLLLGGHTSDPSIGEIYSDCGIARLLPNGQLDPVFGINGTLTIDGGFGLEPARPDGCLGMTADERSILLFGTRQPNGSNDFDSLLIKLDQDDLFRDGYESQP